MIPVSRPYYPDSEIKKLMQEIAKILKTGELVKGPYLEKFEKEFSKYIGCKEAVGFNSGTAALETALKCIDVHNQEVITTANTCPSVINSIIFAGGIPVLVDIAYDTLALDSKKLEAMISDKTRAVIIVHIAGNIQRDIQDIQEICKRHELVLIEDSCRALGSKFGDKLAGNFGDISCFSFYAAKQLSTGNGGMLTTNNKKISDKAKILREHGRLRTEEGTYLYKELGHNMILDELGAILGLSQLKFMNAFISERNNIAERYDRAIKKLRYLNRAINISSKVVSECSYYRYPIILEENINPSDFENYFNKLGINLGHYYPMIHEIEMYNLKGYEIKSNELDVSSSLSKRLFSLPIFNSMKKEQVEKITKALLDYKFSSS